VVRRCRPTDCASPRTAVVLVEEPRIVLRLRARPRARPVHPGEECPLRALLLQRLLYVVHQILGGRDSAGSASPPRPAPCARSGIPRKEHRIAAPSARFAPKTFPATANPSSTTGRASSESGIDNAPLPRPPRLWSIGSSPRLQPANGVHPPPGHPRCFGIAARNGQDGLRLANAHLATLHGEADEWRSRNFPARAAPSSARCWQRSPAFRGRSRRCRNSRGGARDRPCSRDPSPSPMATRPRRALARRGEEPVNEHAPPPHTPPRFARAAAATRAWPPLSRARPGTGRPEWQDGRRLRSPILSTTPL